jgi:hypothetical protein
VYRWYPLSPSRCSPLPPTNAYSPSPPPATVARPPSTFSHGR